MIDLSLVYGKCLPGWKFRRYGLLMVAGYFKALIKKIVNNMWWELEEIGIYFFQHRDFVIIKRLSGPGEECS